MDWLPPGTQQRTVSSARQRASGLTAVPPSPNPEQCTFALQAAEGEAQAGQWCGAWAAWV